jgi:hypothetical protein
MFANPKTFFCLLLFLCVTGATAVGTYGQKKPAKSAKIKEFVPMPGSQPPGFFNGDDHVTSERSIVVDPNVAVKLCVSEGNLRVNGWRRAEVRVFVKSGRKFKLKPLEKSPESDRVNWLRITTISEERLGPASDCLAGESIEIDAPVGASLDLSGREVRTSIDSIKKVNANIVAGAIMLRNITGGISAQTGQGDLIVENSSGSIALYGTTGNIVVAEVRAGQIGDQLRTKTQSGAISLQRVEHRQIEASSISGSLHFDGKFLKGGIYNFRTSNGSIELTIPVASSCTFKATYGVGSFNYDIPLKILTENITPRAKVVVATMGSGDAAVSLTTSTGTIGIRKAGAKL